MIPTTLCMQRVLPWHMHSLDFIPFARRYLGYHLLFSFPQGTKMFQFPWFDFLTTMDSLWDTGI